MSKEKILVIQTAFIGDAILTLPLIQKLKDKFPRCSIDVLSNPASREIFASSPYVNSVTVYDKRDRDKSLFKIFPLASNIKKQGYTRIYSPHRSVRTSLIVKLSGVKETYGFSNASMTSAYRHIVQYYKGWHEVQRNLSLAGLEDDWKVLPKLQATEEVSTKIKVLLENHHSKKFAAVAPGSVWQTKKYPKERFVEIINFLKNKSFYIFLIGGQSDGEYCREIAGSFTEGVQSLAGTMSILESIEILKHCSILISNDSAPTHFAMCADIRVLTIYCSTVPDFGFYPYNEGSRFISFDGLKCKPCGIHGHNECPIKTYDCAYRLENEQIFKAISEMVLAGNNESCLEL